MTIEFQGFDGLHKIDKNNYNNLAEVLGLNDDFLLDLIELDKYNVCPILCINQNVITEEGPIPAGNIITSVGQERFKRLIELKIISI